jgi:hypothetical protein
MTINYRKQKFSQAEQTIIKNDIAIIKERHPNYTPVLIRSADSSLVLDKVKYLIPHGLTVTEFMMTIRKKIQCNETEGLYIFVNNTIPIGSQTIYEVYNEHFDQTINMLVINVAKEATFGN